MDLNIDLMYCGESNVAFGRPQTEFVRAACCPNKREQQRQHPIFRNKGGERPFRYGLLIMKNQYWLFASLSWKLDVHPKNKSKGGENWKWYIIVAWMTHRHLNPRQFGKLSVNRMEASLATKHPISRATTTIKPKSRTSTKPKVSKNALLFTIVFRCMAEVT